jgi:hypothetical protein
MWRSRSATTAWTVTRWTWWWSPTPKAFFGIGDQGVGGIDIAIGKLAVYIAAAGLHPRRVIPVVLDMGIDNLRLLNDDMCIGNRHARVRDHRYDDLIDAYVTAAAKLFPHAMLHWEDFGAGNARRILNKYASSTSTHRMCARSTTTCKGPRQWCWPPQFTRRCAARSIRRSN